MDPLEWRTVAEGQLNMCRGKRRERRGREKEEKRKICQFTSHHSFSPSPIFIPTFLSSPSSTLSYLMSGSKGQQKSGSNGGDGIVSKSYFEPFHQ